VGRHQKVGKSDCEVVCYVSVSVFLSVGHDRDPAKTTELIEPYEFRCPRNHDLDGGAHWCNLANTMARSVRLCCRLLPLRSNLLQFPYSYDTVFTLLSQLYNRLGELCK